MLGTITNGSPVLGINPSNSTVNKNSVKLRDDENVYFIFLLFSVVTDDAEDAFVSLQTRNSSNIKKEKMKKNLFGLFVWRKSFVTTLF